MREKRSKIYEDRKVRREIYVYKLFANSDVDEREMREGGEREREIEEAFRRSRPKFSRSSASPTDLIRGVPLHLAVPRTKTSIIRQLCLAFVFQREDLRRRMTPGTSS